MNASKRSSSASSSLKRSPETVAYDRDSNASSGISAEYSLASASSSSVIACPQSASARRPVRLSVLADIGLIRK